MTQLSSDIHDIIIVMWLIYWSISSIYLNLSVILTNYIVNVVVVGGGGGDGAKFYIDDI